MGWVVNTKPRPLYPRERPGIHCIGGWVGPRAGLDGCGKSRPDRDSMPGQSSRWQVAIPTELSPTTHKDWIKHQNCFNSSARFGKAGFFWGGRKCKAPLILNPGDRSRLVVITRQPIYRREITRVPTEYEPWWAPEPVWVFRRKHVLLLPGFKPPDHPVYSKVAKPKRPAPLQFPFPTK